MHARARVLEGIRRNEHRCSPKPRSSASSRGRRGIEGRTAELIEHLAWGQPRRGCGTGDVTTVFACGLDEQRKEAAHFQQRRGEGIEPSKRGAAPPCRF